MEQVGFRGQFVLLCVAQALHFNVSKFFFFLFFFFILVPRSVCKRPRDLTSKKRRNPPPLTAYTICCSWYLLHVFRCFSPLEPVAYRFPRFAPVEYRFPRFAPVAHHFPLFEPVARVFPRFSSSQLRACVFTYLDPLNVFCRAGPVEHIFLHFASMPVAHHFPGFSVSQLGACFHVLGPFNLLFFRAGPVERVSRVWHLLRLFSHT